MEWRCGSKVCMEMKWYRCEGLWCRALSACSEEVVCP